MTWRKPGSAAAIPGCPPRNGTTSRKRLPAPAGPGSSCSPASTPGSLSAALLKVARYPNVSVAERRDSTVAW